MIRRIRFSCVSNDEAVQRSTICLSRQYVTRPVFSRIPAWGDSMMFVLARQRRRGAGRSRRLIVNISDRPSSRLSAPEGYSYASHSDSFFNFAIPCSAGSRNAAFIAALTLTEDSLGSPVLSGGTLLNDRRPRVAAEGRVVQILRPQRHGCSRETTLSSAKSYRN